MRTQTSAAGNLFQYYFAGSRTEEVGPGGTARTFYIDGEGNQLQIGDPVGNWTLKDYDGQSRVVRETGPEGNRTEYAYDDRSCALANGSCTHNVATVSRIPRAGSGDPVLTQKFTYEPSFGLPLSSTDARGLTTSYEYRVPSYGIQLAKIIRPAVGGMAPVTETVYEEVTLRERKLSAPDSRDGEDRWHAQRVDHHQLRSGWNACGHDSGRGWTEDQDRYHL